MKRNYNLTKFVASYADPEKLPASDMPEISFVGRSNVGKSSLMNTIFNRKNLVKVSSRPGLTRLINFFETDGVHFIDLPGYGFAKVSKSEMGAWKHLVEGYFKQDRRFALCMVLIDIRHDASDLDKQMVQFLLDQEIPFMLCFTKADKLRGNAQIQKQVRTLCQQFAFAGDVVVCATSSEKGIGIPDVRDLIEEAIRMEAEAFTEEKNA